MNNRLRAFWTLSLVIAATVLFYPGRDYFAKGQWALLYLLIVVFVAGFWGMWLAVLAATLSFFAWNYFFLPPYGTFLIEDPKDWLSLLTFLVVGIIMGLQTGRLKEREQKIAEASSLQEADMLKTTFISAVSHELKTPLSSIMATVTNLLEKDINWSEKEIHKELTAIKEDLDKLTSSISSLIDLSRLESSSWRPRRDWFSLGEIIGTTLNKIAPKQRSRISFFLPPNLPEVKVDFGQMSRLLQNLLENALAYSGNSFPVKIGAENGKDKIKIWVEDEGPGIAEGERNKVFTKFYRGAASVGFAGGTGLGLTIAAEIVRSNGGEIWVEKNVPHGAKIVFSLPKDAP